MFLIDETSAYRPCLYTLNRGFKKVFTRGSLFLPELKKSFYKQAITAMIKIRFAFNLNGYNMELQNEACEWGSLQAAVYVIPPVA